MKSEMNIKKLRADFPFFSHHPHELYWDNAATVHKPKTVIEALITFYEKHNANIHRGVHGLTEYATTRYEQIRDQVAQFINASDRTEIIFTKGATESINMVADIWVRPLLEKRGGAIVTTIAEHHANFLPWQQITREFAPAVNLRLVTLGLTTFLLDSRPENYIDSSTRFVALTLDSNLLGPVWENGIKDVKQFVKAAHEVGASVLIDASQSIAHQPLDVQDLGADFVVFSGHKMMAPTGVGVLYVAAHLHDQLEPYHVGGSMVYSASVEQSRWKEMPFLLEAGTPPIASILGLGAAISYFEKNISFKELKIHEASLCKHFIELLEELEGVVIVGNKEKLKNEGHLVSFVVESMHPHDLTACTSMKQLSMRAGHMCAQPLTNFLGYDATIRASFFVYNMLDEIEKGVRIIEQCYKSLKR